MKFDEPADICGTGCFEAADGTGVAALSVVLSRLLPNLIAKLVHLLIKFFTACK